VTQTLPAPGGTAGRPGATRVVVLLQVEPGCAVEALRHTAKVVGVAEAVPTSGPYDVIATVEVADEPALQRVLGRLRRTPGLAVLRCCRAA
jgi:DNA-binding Lrp family transcriptional regulator